MRQHLLVNSGQYEFAADIESAIEEYCEAFEDSEMSIGMADGFVGAVDVKKDKLKGK